MSLPRTLLLLTLLFSPALITPWPAAPVSAAGSFKTYLPLVIRPPAGSMIYVSTSALFDGKSGSKTAPLKTINAAVALAKPGDTIVVSAGVYDEAITITGVDGSATQPITLQAEGDVTIQPSNGRPLRISSSFWTISGFNFSSGGRKAIAVTFDAPAHNVTLEKSHLFNGTAHGVLLSNGTSNINLLNNEIDHFWHESDDAHGVAIHESHNNLIDGNNIHHNSGDAVQIFSTDSHEMFGRSANGNTISNNWLHEDRENAVDIKSSKNTTVKGNHIWGYRPSENSDGMAIEVHYNAQDVVIASNVITDSNWGIEVSRGKKGGVDYPAMPERVAIHNNTISQTVAVGNGNSGDGAGIVVREARGVMIWNNTIVSAAGTCIVLTWSGEARPHTVQLHNNSSSGCGVAELFLKDTSPSDLRIDYNHYDSPDGGRLKIGSRVYTLPLWTASQGFDSHSMLGSVALPTGNHNASLLLIDRGLDVKLPFCGSAPDLGAVEFDCTTPIQP